MDELTAQIKDIIMAELGLAELPKESDRFEEDLHVDSLDQVSLIIAIESRFGFDIPDADAEQLLTVDSLIQYVGHRNKASA